MLAEHGLYGDMVHCRTGSLENGGGDVERVANVHCRTGSLEMFALVRVSQQ